MRLFSPRKTTLLFVIRDKTKVDIALLLICCRVSNHYMTRVFDISLVHFLFLSLNSPVCF
jgi:hypothetical protein